MNYVYLLRRNAKPIPAISRDDLIWLAGWWEGEGCFTWSNRNVIMSANSTDHDVMTRVGGLLGSTVREVKRQELHHKRCWSTVLTGDRARVWMFRLYPLMGERRKAKIKELLVVI